MVAFGGLIGGLRDLFKARMSSRDACIVIIEIGEQRQRVVKSMAAGAARFSSKERKAPFGVIANGVLFACDIPVKRGIARDQRAFISRKSFADQIDGDGDAEYPFEVGAILR